MKFGIFDHLEMRSDVGLAQQYEERLQLLEQADAAGIYGYHVAEHHHSPLCMAPNHSVYFAAVAERTKQLRFGPLVYVLPLHQPIRLIEEIGMVDQLSNGRYQIGVGRGTGGGTEFAMWGGDPEENNERYDETYEVLMKGLQSEFLTHHGKFFNYEDVWMAVRPYQQPHPPLWYAGNPERAAERGMNFIGAGSIRNIAAHTEKYREVWAQSQQHTDDPLVAKLDQPLYGGMKHIFIADTDDEARERAITAYNSYRTHFAKPAPTGGEATEGTSGAFNDAAKRSIWFRDQANTTATRQGPAALEPEKALELEALLAGSPATIRDFMTRYAEGSGANYFVGAFQWGDLTHKEASHSLELFTSEVMPAVQ